jgi:diguanylate cyclase (GGDEF)-like protein
MAGRAHAAAVRGTLRALFARREDPYAGADLANACRIFALLTVLVTVLELGFLPFEPPTDALGAAGWPLAALAIAVPLAIVRRLMKGGHGSFSGLLMFGFLGVAQIALLQWLAGGAGGPYQNLYLLSVTGAMGIHPPRRAVLILPAVALAASLPLVYDGWDGAAASTIVTDLMMWLALGLVVALLMVYVRAQRVRLREEEGRAQELARTDMLTGLPNRRAFDEALDAELARTRRARSPLSVILLDIDGFKHINDEFGHLEGDACLRGVATAISGAVRASDRCFRWAGDEFAVMLPDTPHGEADEAAERIRSAVARDCSLPNGLTISASYGAAQSTGDLDAAELVGAADIMLLAAKGAREPAPA